MKTVAMRNVSILGCGWLGKSLAISLLDEGYSLIIPVYYNNYDREKPLKDWWPNQSEEYKNAIIKIGKDFKRVIDYLETREDLDTKIADRQMIAQRGINPFLQTSYVNDVVAQNMFLKPINTTFERSNEKSKEESS